MQTSIVFMVKIRINVRDVSEREREREREVAMTFLVEKSICDASLIR